MCSGSTNNEAQLRASNITDYIKTLQRWAPLREKGESAVALLDDSYCVGLFCFRFQAGIGNDGKFAVSRRAQVGCFNGSTMRFIVRAAVFSDGVNGDEPATERSHRTIAAHGRAARGGVGRGDVHRIGGIGVAAGPHSATQTAGDGETVFCGPRRRALRL
jgi:hypothetical protein